MGSDFTKFILLSTRIPFNREALLPLVIADPVLYTFCKRWRKKLFEKVRDDPRTIKAVGRNFNKAGASDDANKLKSLSMG